MRLPPKPGPGSTTPREPDFMSGGPKPKKPIKPVMPGKPTRVVDDSGMMPKGVVSTPSPAPTVDKTGKPLMAKGGMAKKGYVKGGVVKANCGASMKPSLGKWKK